MGDRQRSPTSDFYNIFGFCKNTKTYKSLFGKKNSGNNKTTNKFDSEEEAKFEAKFEAYKKTQRNESNNDEPTTPDGRFFLRRPSFLSRSSSRRSHTPSPRPTFLCKSTSKRGTTPKRSSSTLSRSASRVGTPEAGSPGGSLRGSSRGGSVRGSGGDQTPDQNHQQSSSTTPTMQRSASRRNPIIFSQTSTAARRKPPPIERKLACTLEELCHGGEKKIVIRKEVISEEGMIGEEEEEILKINLKPGWGKGTKITFEGKGDQKPGYLPADIIFLIDEKRHPVFNRKGDDLEIAVEIPLVQALTGCSLSIPLLGGEKMSLSIVEDIIFPGYEKVIRGQGMPNPKETRKRGDLILKFLVNFPSDLSDEQRSEAVSVLQDCS